MTTSKIQQTMNNSDTNYCKMPDGTLICYGSVMVSLNNSSEAVTNITFPQSYISKPKVFCTSATDTAPGFTTSTAYDIFIRSSSETGATIVVKTKQSYTFGCSINYLAIGRWK